MSKKLAGVLGVFSFSDLLQQWDRRLKRLEGMKLLEANGAKVIEAAKSRPCLNPKSRPNRETTAVVRRGSALPAMIKLAVSPPLELRMPLREWSAQSI